MSRFTKNSSIIGLLLGATGYAFYDLIIHTFGKHVNSVTTKSLEDPEFQKQVDIFVKDRTMELLNIPEFLELVEEKAIDISKKVVYTLKNDKDTIDSLATLFYSCIISETVRNAATSVSLDTANILLKDKGLNENGYNYLKDYIGRITNDSQVHSNLGNLVTGTITSYWRKQKVEPSVESTKPENLDKE